MANRGIVNHLAIRSFFSPTLAIATATALVLVASGVLGISPAVAEDSLECGKAEWGATVCIDSVTGEIYWEGEEIVVVGEAPTKAPTEASFEVDDRDDRREKLRNDERGPSGNDGGVAEATSDQQETEEERLAERSRRSSEEEERRAYDCLYNPKTATCEAKKREAACRAVVAEEARKASADHIDLDAVIASSADGGWAGQQRQTDYQTVCASSRHHAQEAGEAAYRLCVAEMDQYVSECKRRGTIFCAGAAGGAKIMYKLPEHWLFSIGAGCKVFYDMACEADWSRKECEEARELVRDIVDRPF